MPSEFHSDLATSTDLLVVRVNQHAVPVVVLKDCIIALAHFDGDAVMEIELKNATTACTIHPTIHPLSKKILAHVEGHVIRFGLTSPQSVWVRIAGLPHIYVFSSVATRVPSGKGVICFGPGVHDVGRIELSSGQTLYLGEGAVVRGLVRAVDAQRITIAGPGVLDGGNHPGRLVMLENCQDVTIRDLTMVRPGGWMLTMGNCDRVSIDSLHQVGYVVSSDGIDICGSRDVLVRGCFLRNNDDCVVIKALDARPKAGTPFDDWSPVMPWNTDVRDVLVEGCVFWNDRAGNVTEIGHELDCSTVERVTFRDIDALCCHGMGAPIAIHNCDQAHVRDVLYDNWRIEHYWDKLLDLRVMDSRFSLTGRRGQLSDVTLRDIAVARSEFNLGYSIALIGGASPDHLARDIHIQNLRINHQPITSGDQIDLHTRHCQHVSFS